MKETKPAVSKYHHALDIHTRLDLFFVENIKTPPKHRLSKSFKREVGSINVSSRSSSKSPNCEHRPSDFFAVLFAFLPSSKFLKRKAGTSDALFNQPLNLVKMKLVQLPLLFFRPQNLVKDRQIDTFLPFSKSP